MIKDIETAQEFTTTTVALVTTHHLGKNNVMSAEWTIRSSIDPFLITVFVGYERATYDMIKGSGEFGVSYCSDKQGELAHVAGNHSGRDVDKFALKDFSTFKAAQIKAPLIESSISAFECKVVSEYPVGDHAAFNGQVVEGYYSQDAKPLVFHVGKFRHIGEIIKH